MKLSYGYTSKFLVLVVLVSSLAGALHAVRATGCSQCDEAQVCCRNQWVNASDCDWQLCAINSDCSFDYEVCCDGVCSYLSCPRIEYSEETVRAYIAIIKQVIIGVLAFFVCISGP